MAASLSSGYLASDLLETSSRFSHARHHTYFKPPVFGRIQLEKELELAASIQRRLFPAVLPELAGCELAASYRPARLCGGDYYDVLPTAGSGEFRPHLLCVADAAGKGVPASLLMSNLQAILRTALGYRPTLLELVVRANTLLHAATPEDRYITAIMATFEPLTGKCTFVNAGHHGGVLIRGDGRVEVLNSTGPPLGMLQDLPFSSASVELFPGDVLDLYSDGIPEAFNVREEEWGDERMIRSLQRHRELRPDRMISKILEEIDAFTCGTPQHDDITMLVLKRQR